MNYFGHGLVSLWRGGFFSADDVSILRNGSRLPVVLSMTCLNGLFQDPREECLAEALLRAPNGGAAAVWSSSGLTEPTNQLQMAMTMTRQLLTEGQTLGEAARAAKAATTDPDIRHTWCLLGDPAMRIGD